MNKLNRREAIVAAVAALCLPAVPEPLLELSDRKLFGVSWIVTIKQNPVPEPVIHHFTGIRWVISRHMVGPDGSEQVQLVDAESPEGIELLKRSAPFYSDYYPSHCVLDNV